MSQGGSKSVAASRLRIKQGKKAPRSPKRAAQAKKQCIAQQKQPMSGHLLVTAVLVPINFPGSANCPGQHM